MTWQRLEAGAIDPELTEGMTAAVADPLWFLARQWQVGEFRGEDAASPVLIDGTIVSTPVTEYWFERGGNRHSLAREADGCPLEALVEHEPIVAGPAAKRLRLESGASVLRQLRTAHASSAVLTAFRVGYAFEDQLDLALDPVGAAQLALLARRGLDGQKLAAALAAHGGDASQLPELTDTGAALTRLAAAVDHWYRTEAGLFCDAARGAPSAWSPSRLEYTFGVSAATGGGAIELTAPEYPGGRLDWYHFDVRARPAAVSGTALLPDQDRKSLECLATPLVFAGMPASRFWEFEDHDVDFGDLPAGPDDLARSVIAAYALVAGDNWFVAPCTLPAGSLAEVTRVRVLDDFGSWTSVPASAVHDGSAGSRPWRFFELAGDPGPAREEAPLLFLPPVVAGAAQSRPLESVDFRRDEMANLAWAIEQRVESEAGRAVDREAERGREPASVTVEAPGWRYQLSTEVPDHWLPLVPVRIPGPTPQIALRRGRLAANGGGHLPQGIVLEPDRPFVMHEEEIPAGGIRVERRYQLARGVDGKVYVWMGRRKSLGGGLMRRTPLRFDALTGWEKSRA